MRRYQSIAMAAKNVIINPPQLNDDIAYSDWKKEIDFWQIATSIKEEKQGAAIFLSLTGKSREAVLELTKEEISGNEGVKKVIEKLDGLWKEDDKKQAFNAYEKFEQFRRPEHMGVTDYLNAFERLNNKLKMHQMNLPEGVLAYRVLKSANLTSEQEQLAKATVTDITYKAMCEKLKAIFGDNVRQKMEKPAVEIKQEQFYSDVPEETYYNTGSGYGQRGGRGRFSFRAGNRGGGRQVRFDNNNTRGDYNGRGDYNARGDNRQKFPVQRRNPIDNRGQVSRCSVCGSQYHWMKDCPNKVSFTMFTQSTIQECYVSKLVGETFSGGVLDCGCTKSVCGADWYNEYVKTLSDEDKTSMTKQVSKMPYKFGPGDIVHSYMQVQLPIYIGETKGMLEVEVVKEEVPLLISTPAMKKAGVILNFKDDTANFNGQVIKLEVLTSGHYMIPLVKAKSKIIEHALLTLNVEEMSTKEKQKIAAKLHSQFGHPSHDKLREFVKTAGVKDGEFFNILEKHTLTCEICERYRKKNPRPIVGMSLSKEFNGAVAMDLKFYDKSIILHMIDTATRYSAAVIVQNKKKETIVENVIMHWINKFGVPDKILSDNGGEFNNEDMRDMGENLNTTVLTTPAESPWSNGICERHNAVISDMLKKIMKETPGCKLQVALAWAVNAKNSLQNVYGFSPAQLVFGYNPNLPSTMNDKLPALAGTTMSKEVATHLNAKHEARKAFIECEASEKVRRALRRQVRQSTTKVFEPNDRVYYKRLESDYWKGPATVIGKDNHQVIVKHGGSFVRVHPISLRKVNEQLTSNESQMDMAEHDSAGYKKAHVEEQNNLAKSVERINSIVDIDDSTNEVDDDITTNENNNVNNVTERVSESNDVNNDVTEQVSETHNVTEDVTENQIDEHDDNRNESEIEIENDDLVSSQPTSVLEREMSSQASSQQSLPIVSITEESLENDIINQNNALRTNDSNDEQQCDDNGRHIGDPDVIGDKETTSEEADIRSERDVSHAQDTISSSEDTDRIYQVTSPPMKARIEFRDIGEQNWNECVVTGRAGKVGKTRAGRHKMWANVKMVNDGCMKSVNFDNVEWRYKEESVLLSQSFDYDVIRAQEIEINNLISNGVYTRVDDEGQDYVETRWVLTEKDDEKGDKLVKARLVAKGYQESNVSRTDSPTCGKSNLRMILTIAATNKWKVCSLGGMSSG